jgi:glycerate-2-kinase
MQIERGVPTQDLNAVRNHIDLLKVGRLSMLMGPAFQVHILMWDAGDPLPTKTGSSSYDTLLTQNLWLHALPDHTTFSDAVNAIKKWDARNDIPLSIRKHLETADPHYESPKRKDFEKLSFRIFGVLPRRGPLLEAKKKIKSLGFKPVILTEWMQAEAKDAGRVVAQIAKNIESTRAPFTPPCVLMSTGELLVTIGDSNGVGGRNQEFLLSAALEIKESKKIVMGAVDTDGTDGPGTQFTKEYGEIPCLAGGIIDGYTVEAASRLGINIVEEIKKHNSTLPLLKMDDGVITSQSVSLGDLAITFISDNQ